MTPLDFLNTLWQFKPEEQYILIWTLPDKRSHWFRSADAAGQFAAAANGMDVYVGVGLAGRDYGPARRCKSEEVSGICGIGADLDLMSKAHSNKPLPASIADALSILPVSMPPSIINLSGNGAQAWWLLKEPLLFDSGEERAEAARLVARWHTMLHRNSAVRGWVYERLSDLARVLRIPGTINHKDPANPKDVVVHSLNDARYNLSDFAEFLDDSGIPHTEAEENATREWAKQFADKPPLVIDLNARIPQEMLDGWMAADMRFKNTWLRQRHDLKDQSQSGYDLALADFGVDAGLPEQQIVDLIIHHRGEFPQKRRTRLDYFQRTIAKAFRPRLGLDAPLALLDAPPSPTTTGPAAPQGAPVAPEAGGSTEEATLDPAAAKARLCERISAVLGVRICRLVKITGKEPTYHLELEETKIEFPNVAKGRPKNKIT